MTAAGVHAEHDACCVGAARGAVEEGKGGHIVAEVDAASAVAVAADTDGAAVASYERVASSDGETLLAIAGPLPFL
jgi:uncharacterized protein YdbL (DUF1318 family)